MRVSNNMQKSSCPPSRNVGNMLDESSSDPLLPEMRLDEQGVQLRPAVWARHYGGEAGDGAVALCDEDAAPSNLLNR